MSYIISKEGGKKYSIRKGVFWVTVPILLALVYGGGYFHKYLNQHNKTITAYNEGVESGERLAFLNIFFHAREGHTFIYNGVSITPWKNGSLLLMKIKKPAPTKPKSKKKITRK